MPSDLNNKRVIALPKGGELEMVMSQEFIDRVKKHFDLSPEQEIDDEHIRMFVWGAVNSAVDKVDKK